MTRRLAGWIVLLSCATAAAAAAAPLAAQSLQDRLVARGLSAELAASIAAEVTAAAGAGLPTEPLVDKALEGHAKRVPAPRILAAVRELGGRLTTARDALAGAGMERLGAPVVASAADAMGRGITRDDVVEIIRAAPAAEAAAVGLTVAAALAAQGLDRRQAVTVVVEAMRAGRPVADVLDLPAAAGAMRARGMPPADVGRRLIEGIGRGAGAGRGSGGQGPPIVPPGQGGHRGNAKRP